MVGCSKPGRQRSCVLVKTCLPIRAMGEVLSQGPGQPFAHPGVPRRSVSRPLVSPCLLTALPVPRPCARLCAGRQACTGEQDRHGPSTPGTAHYSCFHPEISSRKPPRRQEAPAASLQYSNLFQRMSDNQYKQWDFSEGAGAKLTSTNSPQRL